jgi:hypothetical protein
MLPAGSVRVPNPANEHPHATVPGWDKYAWRRLLPTWKRVVTAANRK